MTVDKFMEGQTDTWTRNVDDIICKDLLPKRDISCEVGANLLPPATPEDL